jgi:hypothetical protein
MLENSVCLRCTARIPQGTLVGGQMAWGQSGRRAAGYNDEGDSGLSISSAKACPTRAVHYQFDVCRLFDIVP